MLPPRISLALDDRLIVPPVVVVGASADDDWSGLPEPVTLVVTRQPEFDALAARGFDVRTDIPQGAATAIVCLPREKMLARDRIARARATGAPVLVDGTKTDGIDSVLKACRAQGSVGAVISKAHGKIFVLESGDFDAWRVAPWKNDDGYLVAPGVFSADGVDAGSVALMTALAPLKGRIADLGAGWGYLAAHAVKSSDVERIDAVESDLAALDCARANIEDPRAAFHWADATVWAPAEPAHHVIMNPPFHTGRKGTPDLGRAFIANAARILTPRGTLWMVANRHLPYEAQLNESFAEVSELPGTSAFKLYRAARPRRKRQG